MKLFYVGNDSIVRARAVAYCEGRQNADEWEKERWSRIIDKVNSGDAYVLDGVNSGGCVMAVVTNYEFCGQKIWCADRHEKIVASLMAKMIEEPLFFSGGYHEMQDTGFTAVPCDASYAENSYYPVVMRDGIWVNNQEHKYALRDWLEAKYLSPADGWKDRIKYERVNLRDLHNRLYDKEIMDYPWVNAHCGHGAFIGFHYFGFHLPPQDGWWLVASVDNKPIGCICIGEYNDYGYYAVQYIDVSAPYKGNGVAKRMISELAKVMPGDKPLVLSMESAEGAKCHMRECFRREQWPNKLGNSEDY